MVSNIARAQSFPSMHRLSHFVGANTGLQIATVGDGILSTYVEGITLVPASSGSSGYLFVSSQGISAYIVYECTPHRYVITLTIVNNDEGGVDHVSNADRIAVVGNHLNRDFPGGLLSRMTM